MHAGQAGGAGRAGSEEGTADRQGGQGGQGGQGRQGRVFSLLCRCIERAMKNKRSSAYPCCFGSERGTYMNNFCFFSVYKYCTVISIVRATAHPLSRLSELDYSTTRTPSVPKKVALERSRPYYSCPTTCRLVLTPFSCRSNRALKVGPGGRAVPRTITVYSHICCCSFGCPSAGFQRGLQLWRGGPSECVTACPSGVRGCNRTHKYVTDSSHTSRRTSDKKRCVRFACATWHIWS